MAVVVDADLLQDEFVSDLDQVSLRLSEFALSKCDLRRKGVALAAQLTDLCSEGVPFRVSECVDDFPELRELRLEGFLGSE